MIVTCETGQVARITPTGTVSVIATINASLLAWPGAESVLVIPPNPCSFGNSNGAMFSANYNLNAPAPTPTTVHYDFSTTGVPGSIDGPRSDQVIISSER